MITIAWSFDVLRPGTRSSQVALLLLTTIACAPQPKRTSPATLRALDFQQQLSAAIEARAGECAQVPKAMTAGLAATHGLGRFNLGKSLAADRIAFDDAQVVACIDSLKKLPCENVRVALETLTGPCEKVITGKVALGGECYESLECAAGLACATAGCPGKCAKALQEGGHCDDKHPCGPELACICTDGGCRVHACVPHGKIGANCGHAEDAPCDGKLYCPPVGARMANACQPKAGANAVCPSSDACKPPLVCVGLQSSKHPGVCKPPLDNGAACTPGKNECGETASCVVSGKGGKCTAWGGPGSACGISGAEYAGCAFSYCDMAKGQTTGTCRAYKTDGDACDPAGPLDACGPGQCDRVALTCVYACNEK